MKIEILCRSCGRGYLVEESGLPEGGGEAPCLHCGASIPVDPRTAKAVPEGTPPSPPVVRQAAVAAEMAAADLDAEQVVCPRCGLHFEPRKAHEVARSGDDRPVVLIVEDMPYFLEIARDALADRFEVRSATTVDAALEIVRGGGIHLIVVDLNLEGGENGERILESLQPKPCPILIFTAEDESEMYGAEWDRLQALGADDLVLKGMNVGEELLRKVGTMLGVAWDDD